jgi:hypothetical protein
MIIQVCAAADIPQGSRVRDPSVRFLIPSARRPSVPYRWHFKSDMGVAHLFARKSVVGSAFCGLGNCSQLVGGFHWSTLERHSGSYQREPKTWLNCHILFAIWKLRRCTIFPISTRLYTNHGNTALLSSFSRQDPIKEKGRERYTLAEILKLSMDGINKAQLIF